GSLLIGVVVLLAAIAVGAPGRLLSIGCTAVALACLAFAWRTDRAYRSVAESERRLRSLLEVAFDGVIVHRDGRIVDVSASFLATYRFELPEVIGRPLESFLAPESRA